MAFKFLDTCGDQYAISDILRLWTQAYGGLDPAKYFIASAGGRRGTNAIRIRNVIGGYQALARLVNPNTTTALLGFAHKGSGSVSGWGSLFTPSGGGNSLNLVQVNAGALDVRVNVLAAIRQAYYTHIALSINTNGTISVYRGHANSIGGAGLQGQDRIAATIGTTPFALQYNQFNYIELKTVIHETAGSVLLKVNGDIWLNAAGIRTQADGASSVTEWQELAVGGHQSNGAADDWYFDDLYLGDSDLSDAFDQMSDLVGDVAINYANVFIDGAMTEWTPSSGPNHFAMVDEIPPNLDTDYNGTTTVAAIDTFQKTAVPVAGAGVIALSPIYLRRRTEGADTTTSAVIRDAAANFTGSKEGSAAAEGDPSDYAYNWWTVTRRPSNSAVTLTQALVDAMEVGYKKVS